jgi:hypothetical protein
MRLLMIGTLVLAGCCWTMTGQAQELPAPVPPGPPSPSDLAVPPAARAAAEYDWQRYQNPRDIARQRSAAEADQRQARLSAQRWYGYSPLRPVVSAVPATSNYFPIWNTDVPRPFQWYAVYHPATFERGLIYDVR